MVPSTRRAALRTVGLVGATALAGCGAFARFRGPNERPPETLGTTWSPPADEWRLPRADPRNTASSSRGASTRPAVVWENRQGSASRAIEVSGHVVGATRDAVVTTVRRDGGVVLHAYDATDGTRRWQRQIQYPQGRRYPRFGGLVGGTLYLTDSATDAVAVDASDGTVRWRTNLYEQVSQTVPERFLTESARSPGLFSPIPLATPDTVYVQTSYGLHGLAPDDGREQWRLYLGDQTEYDDVLGDPGGLALTESRVWASYHKPVPAMYTVGLFDGEPTVRRTSAPTSPPGPPVVTREGAVAVADRAIWSTDAHRTLAFGVAGGAGVTWQFPGLASDGAAAYSSLATDGKRVFVCEGHEREERFVVYALRASTGGIEWIYRDSLADRAISPASPGDFRLCHPAVAGDTLLVGYGASPERETGQGVVVALSTDGGREGSDDGREGSDGGSERWRTSLPVAPRDVAVAGDWVYVGGWRRGVVALRPDGGADQHRVAGEGSV